MLTGLVNNLGELNRLVAELEQLAEEWKIPPKAGMELNLILEELFTNIVFYAFDDGRDHDILVTFTHPQPVIIKICLEDDGKAFNLLEKDTGNSINHPIEERQIGGLGIHFVKNLVNDISYEHAPSQDLIAAYQQIIDRAHAKGIRIFGATILPIGNSVKYSTANEATRQAVNAWIRGSGQFDAVLDFEQVVRDSDSSPLRIYQNLTCGGTGSCCDYVHPNSQGYLQIAQSIPLSLFNTRLLTFYAPGFDTNGIVHWWMDFDPSLAYVIESSTNLTNWTTTLTVTNAPSIYFSDPDSKTQPLRYFRARQVP